MNEFHNIGKFLVIAGIVISLIGVIVMFGSRFNLFNLPGDLTFQGKNWKLFFPIGTSIAISIILTAILWFISRFFR